MNPYLATIAILFFLLWLIQCWVTHRQRKTINLWIEISDRHKENFDDMKISRDAWKKDADEALRLLQKAVADRR